MLLPVTAALLAALLGCAATAAGQQAPALHLDHVPVAVRSLDGAVRTYGDHLGFRVKPGRAHANGIRNAFVKLSDGSYLELITAGEATDSLSRWYRNYLLRGEGGAFVSLRADSLSVAARTFREHGYEGSLQRYGEAFSILSFPGSALASVFLIEYPQPVRDDPALLEHPNTALGLHAAWLPGSAFEALDRLSAPGPVGGGGDILLAGGAIARSTLSSEARVPGVTIRGRSLAAAEEALRRGTGERFPVRADGRGRSILVPPRLTHGLWLEFLEPHPPRPAARTGG